MKRIDHDSGLQLEDVVKPGQIVAVFPNRDPFSRLLAGGYLKTTDFAGVKTRSYPLQLGDPGTPVFFYTTSNPHDAAGFLYRLHKKHGITEENAFRYRQRVCGWGLYAETVDTDKTDVRTTKILTETQMALNGTRHAIRQADFDQHGADGLYPYVFEEGLRLHHRQGNADIVGAERYVIAFGRVTAIKPIPFDYPSAAVRVAYARVDTLEPLTLSPAQKADAEKISRPNRRIHAQARHHR